MIERDRPQLNALPAVVLENHRRFLAFLATRVESEAVAEDILHAAYARALEKGNQLKEDEKVIPWFYRNLRNALVDHYRRKGLEKRATERIGAETDHRRDALEREMERTVCACVTSIIDTLKPEYAVVLKKAELEGRAVNDLAKELKTTPTNVSVRLHRARASLKKKVMQTCGACAAHGCMDCACHPPRV